MLTPEERTTLEEALLELGPVTLRLRADPGGTFSAQIDRGLMTYRTSSSSIVTAVASVIGLAGKRRG
jgi:hypothetical protein